MFCPTPSNALFYVNRLLKMCHSFFGISVKSKENYFFNNFNHWQVFRFIGGFNVLKLPKVLMTIAGYVENVPGC